MQFIFCSRLFVLPGRAMEMGELEQRLDASQMRLQAKIFRVMRITTFLLFTICLHAHSTGLSQGITINQKDVPITKIFQEIRQQTGYRFLYRNQDLSQLGNVSINVHKASLQEILQKCLSGQQLEWIIREKTIIIRKNLLSGNGHKPATFTQYPPKDISGRLLGPSGEPIVGATVTILGTNRSVVTNAGGEFAIQNVEENAILIISHVQYQPMRISVKGLTNVSATLQVKVSSMDELQVIGYGKTTKRLNTGNITTVKGAEIASQPVTNPLLALQGRVPGLIVTQSTGMPGSGVTVRIQGVNSITKGNDPLYIVDGVPYTSQLLPTLSPVLGSSGGVSLNDVPAGDGNPLNFINPADIERIDVLKDADATSIYGSRAANGVILITTKMGKSGKTSVDLNLRSGWGKVTNNLNLLNNLQYLAMRKEAIINSNSTVTDADYDINGVWDTTRNTDWQKELIGKTARYTDANVSISGGNSSTQFIVSSTYHKETTVFPGDFDDKKGSLHLSINNTSFNNKLKFNITGSYLSDNNSIAQSDPTLDATLTAPTAPALRNADNSLNWAPSITGASTWTNPLSYLQQTYNVKTNNLIGNAILSYQILKNLQIKSSFGYNSLESDQIITVPLTSIAPEMRPFSKRLSAFAFNTVRSYIIEPQIEYTHPVLNGILQLLAGTTLNQIKSHSSTLIATGFNNDLVLEDLKSASNITAGNTFVLDYKYNAVFGRMTYNLHDKYILNFSARRDGSSRFGSENLFHDFWSIGGAWIFSEERFLEKDDVLSFGKIRASYGTSGNDQIGDYQFMNLYSSQGGVGVPYQGATGLMPDRLTNPFIQWEETNKLQGGLELGFVRNRILANLTVYRNQSSNQLLQYSLPITTGFTNQLRNFPAKVENRGIEFSVTSINFQNEDFRWTTNLNGSIVRNELLSFPDLDKSTYSTMLQLGKPIDAQQVFRSAGVDPANGLYQFYDAKDNLTAFPDYSADLNQLVNRNPTCYGGLENTVRWKSVEVSALFQFVKQKGQNYYFGNRPGAYNFNQPTWVLDHWQKQGDIKPIQRYGTGVNELISYFYNQLGDAAWTDASFIRLKNVSISWALSSWWSHRLKLENLRLFAQGQNLATITRYKGRDPETRSSFTLPPLRVITLGVQVTL